LVKLQVFKAKGAAPERRDVIVWQWRGAAPDAVEGQMEFIAAMGGHLWSVLTYAVPFLFLLGVVVFIHELGHFLVGRWCGVRVLTFSLGFGRELFGFYDKHGTRWKISALPLGGYVKFYGDMNVASAPDMEAVRQMSAEEQRESFPLKPIWQRALIVVAGPVANFLLAIVLFAGLVMFAGRNVNDPYIGAVVPGSAGEAAGFRAGDKILRINDRDVVTFEDIQRLVNPNAGVEVAVRILRDGQESVIRVTPRMDERKERLGVVRIGLIGLRASADPAHRHREYYGPVRALAHGAGETWFVIYRTMDYLGKLVTGREYADQLSGLPRVVQASGEVTKSGGLTALLALTALMSVSIGLLNLFPIPMLDGGHLMFYAYEAIRRKPASEMAMEMSFRVGFGLVIALMLLATWNDIKHFVSL
jgi:regulator of sigma E protease